MTTSAVELHHVAAIDEVIARFVAVFDNRAGRVPDAAAFGELFGAHATITAHSARGVEIRTLEAFVAPRVELLTSARLVDFHEWETRADIEILGSLAVRRSRYEKSGTFDGEPCGGAGTKCFQLAHPEGTWRIVAMAWVDDAR